jgi:hypothetical protein
LGRPRKYKDDKEADRERQRRRRAILKQPVEPAITIDAAPLLKRPVEPAITIDAAPLLKRPVEPAITIDAAFLLNVALKAWEGKPTPTIQDCEDQATVMSRSVTLIGMTNKEYLSSNVRKSGIEFQKHLVPRMLFLIKLAEKTTATPLGAGELSTENILDALFLTRSSREVGILEEAWAATQSVLGFHEKRIRESYDWKCLALPLFVCARRLMLQDGKVAPRSISPGSKICLFAKYFLEDYGISRGEKAVSSALKIARDEVAEVRALKNRIKNRPKNRGVTQVER